MEEFEKALSDVFNASSLPFEAKLYALKHLYIMADLNYQLEIERRKSKQEEQPNEQVSH